MALSFDDLIAFAARHYMKNRTIVSRDIKGIIDDLEATLDLPVIRHRFKTGEDCGSWIIPPSWDIKEAWIKEKGGKVIASYEDHPLFVCPYSKPVHLTLSKAELLPHVFSEPRIPSAFGYNWRYAYDANLRLQDWGISLPLDTVNALDEGPFEVSIDAGISDGEMLVGEVFLKGHRKEELIFLANYCHPGQVNDSFSGLMLFMKVMRELAERKDREYSYRFLFMPETIGSAAYLARHHGLLKNAVGAVFSEMIASGEKWYIKQTRRADTYLDSLGREMKRAFPEIDLTPFFSVYGNDELMFDSVQSGIPAISLQKYPFHEYHTNLDDVDRIDRDDLNKAYEMMMHLIHVLEHDAVYRFIHKAPFWMTRYKLFSDDVYEPEEFRMKFDVVYKYLDGRRSIVDVAEALGVSFNKVLPFVQAMAKHGLIEQVTG